MELRAGFQPVAYTFVGHRLYVWLYGKSASPGFWRAGGTRECPDPPSVGDVTIRAIPPFFVFFKKVFWRISGKIFLAG